MPKSGLSRNKNRDGVYTMGGHLQRGLFVNNICDNTELPAECRDEPRSLFYFTFRSVDGQSHCLPLLSIHERDQVREPDNDRPDKMFTIADKSADRLFRLIVVCDSRYNYPQYTVTTDHKGIAEFQVASKFSCGEINESAKDLDNQKVWICLLLILFGLFILTVAGTSFKRFMIVVAGIIAFVFLIFVIFSYFGFQLGGYASAFIMGGAASVAFFINFILKKVKQIFDGLTTLLTVKIGYTYGAILFPNSPIHERVDS